MYILMADWLPGKPSFAGSNFLAENFYREAAQELLQVGCPT